MESIFRPDLFKGKVVLVTGGGTGIGLGIARMFAQHGARVVISGRREQPLREACASLGAHAASFVTGDVRSEEACRKMVDKAVAEFGRLDVLVNNAAGNFVTPAEDLTPNAFKTVMDIDLHGSFNMARAALPELKKTQGVVINITATLYHKVTPFQLHASAAKAAIDVMTNQLGVEWGADYGVRAVSIAPGPIADTVGGPTGRVFGGSGVADVAKSVRNIVPIGRFGTVNDIAACCLFVASPMGSFINATKITVDGGHWHESSAMYLRGRDAVRAKSDVERKQKGSGSGRAPAKL